MGGATINAMVNGRGAWSTAGKDNGSVMYEYLPGRAVDGAASPWRGAAWQAVTFAVNAIQVCVNLQSAAAAAPLVCDGRYGPVTAAAVAGFQRDRGLKPDGRAGAVTCARLWRAVIIDAAAAAQVPARLLYGLMMHESSADPGACGYEHDADRGLWQINTAAEPVTVAQAHQPVTAAAFTSIRLAQALTLFAGQGEALQVACAVLQHNSPAGARTLWRTGGMYASDAHRSYVVAVQSAAAAWGEQA